MSRANPPPETHRECRSCRQVHELTLKHFGLHLTCRGGFNTQCKDCVRLGKKVSRLRLVEVRAKAAPPLKDGQICPECFDLTHRRPQHGCARCGLSYAPESPLELVTRRTWNYAV
jgi:hypothetical protein